MTQACRKKQLEASTPVRKYERTTWKDLISEQRRELSELYPASFATLSGRIDHLDLQQQVNQRDGTLETFGSNDTRASEKIKIKGTCSQTSRLGVITVFLPLMIQ